MNWTELSDNAKSVIEWVENPYTRKRETVAVKVGEKFTKNLYGKQIVSIPITKVLFDEIHSFVSMDSNIQSVINLEGELMFAIKPESNLRLH